MFKQILGGAALAVLATGAFAAADYPSGYTKCAKDGATCSFSEPESDI